MQCHSTPYNGPAKAFPSNRPGCVDVATPPIVTDPIATPIAAPASEKSVLPSNIAININLNSPSKRKHSDTSVVNNRSSKNCPNVLTALNHQPLKSGVAIRSDIELMPPPTPSIPAGIDLLASQSPRSQQPHTPPNSRRSDTPRSNTPAASRPTTPQRPHNSINSITARNLQLAGTPERRNSIAAVVSATPKDFLDVLRRTCIERNKIKAAATAAAVVSSPAKQIERPTVDDLPADSEEFIKENSLRTSQSLQYQLLNRERSTLIGNLSVRPPQLKRGLRSRPIVSQPI